MRSIMLVRVIVTCFFAGTLIASALTQEGSSTKPAVSPSASQQVQPPQAESKLKVNTRLVTVDVVATDSRGEPVRDFAAADFQVFEDRSVRQDISHFELLGNAPEPTGAEDRTASSGGVFSNMLTTGQFDHPPTILLVDGLNTNTINQLQVRRKMIQLLDTLPPKTPIAVFLLGSSLEMLQNFTTDTTLLRDAVERSTRVTSVQKNPQLDNSIVSAELEMQSVAAMDVNIQLMMQGLEDFEKEQYAQSVQDRMLRTMQALRSLANYMSGYPGRKNLIWFTEGFPLYLAPQLGFGSDWDWSRGTGEFNQKVKEAANAIGDAQLAIYPVDAKGMATWESFSAERVIPGSVPASQQAPGENPLLPGTGVQTHLEEQEWNASEATMTAIANATGGQTCMHSNDLGGCVEKAMKDGSVYYELSFYPRSIRWDGAFHSITVKTTRPHVHLEYRHGFYAEDKDSLVKKLTSRDRAKDECDEPLPSTEIYLTAKAQESPDPEKIKYLLTVSPADLQLPRAGDSRSLDILVATCLYDPRGNSGQYFDEEDSVSVSDADFRKWKSSGIPDFVTVKRDPSASKLRIVVVDKNSGLTGSVDVPLSLPTEGKELAGGQSALPANHLKPDLEKEANEEGAESSSIPYFAKPYFLRFRTQQGQSATVDWSKGAVSYTGDIPLNVTTSFFFQSFFGSRFHCQSGVLVSNDANSKAAPDLEFKFIDPAGKFGVVDLRGAEPQYSGDLPFDASARAFFEDELALCQCRTK
jgi:VWFA-related protein